MPARRRPAAAKGRTVEHALALVDDITERALWLDAESRAAGYYAALGTTSEAAATVARESDRVGELATRKQLDAYKAACDLILRDLTRWLTEITAGGACHCGGAHRGLMDRDPREEASLTRQAG